VHDGVGRRGYATAQFLLGLFHPTPPRKKMTYADSRVTSISNIRDHIGHTCRPSRDLYTDILPSAHIHTHLKFTRWLRHHSVVQEIQLSLTDRAQHHITVLPNTPVCRSIMSNTQITYVCTRAVTRLHTSSLKIAHWCHLSVRSRGWQSLRPHTKSSPGQVGPWTTRPQVHSAPKWTQLQDNSAPKRI